MPPDLLVVGHIVKDINGDGWRPGGGALYAALQAHALGARVACVAGGHRDLAFPRAGIEWHCVDEANDVVFDNRYEEGRRSQRVSGGGRILGLDHIPTAWLKAPAVLLAPVLHEIDVALPAALRRPGTLVGLSAQGWLRRVENGEVLPGRVDAAARWAHGDVLFVSEEDVIDPGEVAEWAAKLPVVVLTRAERGSTLWVDGVRREVPAAAAQEIIDPTGAGDVFAAAFMVRYGENRDAEDAARFAAAAAALSLRGRGFDGLATREDVTALLAGGEAASVQ